VISSTRGALAAPPTLDQNGAKLPVAPSHFSFVRGASQLQYGEYTWGIRLSHLSAPLSARRPNTEPGGTNLPLVANATSMEFVATTGVGSNWNLGVAWGAQLHQTGAGYSALNDSDEGLPSLGAHDPRIEVGRTFQFSHLQARPYLLLQIPLGRPEAFASEDDPMVETGLAIAGQTRHLRWGAELGATLRETTDIGASRWGSQLNLKSGFLYRPLPEFGMGPEVRFSPVLGTQTSRAGNSSGALLPAEALFTIAYTANSYGLKLGVGSGLPLQRTSSAHVRRTWTRGPTSPSLRLLLGLRIRLD